MRSKKTQELSDDAFAPVKRRREREEGYNPRDSEEEGEWGFRAREVAHNNHGMQKTESRAKAGNRNIRLKRSGTRTS